MNPDYQFRLPTFLSYSFPAVIVSIVVAVGSLYVLGDYKVASYGVAILVLSIGFAYVGICSTVKNYTNLEKRLDDRDLLLSKIPWKGSESILDIGCGNGILLLSAAKLIPDGKAIGIDLWTENSGDNRKEIFLKNAEIEGVKDRVLLQTTDARMLPYKDDSIDVILCGLTMHHILHDTGAEKAVREMVRVVRQEGYVAVYDVPIAIYSTSKLLVKEGIEVTKINSRILIGKKTANNSLQPTRDFPRD